MMTYAETVLGRQIDGVKDWDALISEVLAIAPWMPVNGRHYRGGVRAFVGAMYPKLSAWLFARKDDRERLGCAQQLQKLRARMTAEKVRAEDRKEMKAAHSALRATTTSYRANRDAFKTHQRSAWNVCK